MQEKTKLMINNSNSIEPWLSKSNNALKRLSPITIAKIKEATSAATHHLLEHCNICALFPKAAAKPDEVALASAR